MAINVSRAINRHTAVTATLEVWVEGSWDEDNQWVEGGFKDPIQFLVVPTSVGNTDQDGIFGAKLDPRKEGERISEYMQFISNIELPIRSKVTVYGREFKITRKGDYSGYGYWKTVGRGHQ